MSSKSQLTRRRPGSRWDSDVVLEGAGADHHEAFAAVFDAAQIDDRIYVCDDLEDRVVHTHYVVKATAIAQVTQSQVTK